MTVEISPVVLESYYEFAPAIVWDALTDPDLVSGWLAPATIDPRAEGRYLLEWGYPSGARVVVGRLSVFDPYRRLEFSSSTGTIIAIELHELAVGLRGTSTHMRIIAAPAADGGSAEVRADWLTALDQLDELLRGHPVDWSSWTQDHLESWTRHLREVENTIA